MNLEEMKAARETVERKKSPVIEVPILGELVSVQFTRAIGTDWIGQTAKHPPREGVTIDKNFNYDVDAVTRVIAEQTGRRLVDGAEIKDSPEWWEIFFAELDGYWAGIIRLTVWGLNEWEPRGEVEELKKALAEQSAPTSD